MYSLNKRLNKQWDCRWFENLWRSCVIIFMCQLRILLGKLCSRVEPIIPTDLANNVAMCNWNIYRGGVYNRCLAPAEWVYNVAQVIMWEEAKQIIVGSRLVSPIQEFHDIASLLANGSAAFKWKLRSHWLKGLWHIASVLQTPESCWNRCDLSSIPAY